MSAPPSRARRSGDYEARVWSRTASLTFAPRLQQLTGTFTIISMGLLAGSLSCT